MCTASPPPNLTLARIDRAQTTCTTPPPPCQPRSPTQLEGLGSQLHDLLHSPCRTLYQATSTRLKEDRTPKQNPIQGMFNIYR